MSLSGFRELLYSCNNVGGEEEEGECVYQFPESLDTILHKYVIRYSEHATRGWEFQNLFVLEFTTFNSLLLFGTLFLWVINRQTHIRPTKGSKINYKDKEDEDDKEEEENRKEDIERESLISQFASYDTEDDEDEEDDGLYDSYDSLGLTSSIHLEDIPLTKEKQELLKVLREIKIFSYFEDDAIALCLEHVEFLNLQTAGESVFHRNEYDGSLYAVLSGSVRCQFHNYPDEEASNEETGEERIFGSSFQKGEVLTSLLAMLAGMVANTEEEKEDEATASNNMLAFIMPFAKDVSAFALEDDSRLIRVPPKCLAKILDRCPIDVYRIAQTVLNRAQQLTVLTLVQTLGLRKELVVSSSSSSSAMKTDKNQSLSNTKEENITQQQEDKLKDKYSIVFARTLGIHCDSADSINLIRENCSIVNVFEGEILIQAGDIHDACYLIIDGTFESGIQVPFACSSYSKKQDNNNSSISEWKFQCCEAKSNGDIIGETVCFTGEMSLFNLECRGNSSGCCTLFQVPRHVYLHLIRRYPKIMANALRGILQKISSEVHLLNWTSEWMYVEAAEKIVHRGEPCDSMFVVLNGRLRAAVSSRIKRREPHLQDLEYGRGKTVGEVGCLTGTRWEHTLYAIRNSEIIRVQMRTLLVIIRTFPTAGLHFARSIAGKVAEHFNPTRRMESSSDHPTSSSFITAPVDQISTRNLMFASTITGDPLSPARSSVHFPTPGNIYQDSPSLMRGGNYGLRLSTIAVVPLTESVSTKEFSSSIVDSFSTIAPCKLLTKQIVRREIGEKVYKVRNKMRDLRIVRLLADMEENNRLVVFQADEKYTWWTRLCIQQADFILLVVDAERAPGRRRVEKSLQLAHQANRVHIDLVIVGRPKQDIEEPDQLDVDFDMDEKMTVSNQLNNWSDKREWILGHHQVRKPFHRYPMDFQRLCRRVSGLAVGLVLGGGGARGLAHIGVIKALKEAGLTVDLVGGTSQGAFIGALFAQQPDDYSHLEKSCRKMAQDMSSIKNKLFDLTLPMTSIFCGRLFNRMLRRSLGRNTRFQDLVLNFFCISVDLQKQQQVVHTKGLLWKYCRASMTLTGYLPPISDKGSLLVDGGYMNVVPADVMRDTMNARLVISVDVSNESEREYFDYGTTLSGWWLLFNSWNPFAKTVKVPSMGDINDMLIWVSSIQHCKKAKMASDLYLLPPVSDIGTLEYNRFDEIVQRGYDYAKPLVEELVRKHSWAAQQHQTTTPTSKKELPIN